MNVYFKTIFSDKILKLSTLCSIGLLVAAIVYILFVYRSLPPYIPLYHQMPWGEARLGAKEQIFFPFILTLIFVIINLVIAITFYNRMPLVSRIINSTSIVITLLASIFLFQSTMLVL
ncbi:MAG: hypothetical protein HYT11_01785 [Candidatus Levybacteria bacterium]|nr:hypothetical protein [Candidatus Levybacteria bacterium]